MSKPLASRTFRDLTGYTDEQWRQIAPQYLKQFEKAHVDPRSQATHRKHLRYQSPDAGPVYCLVRSSKDEWSPYTMRCRDLSEKGMGVYHGAYLHPDTRCYVVFKDMGPAHKILGRVKHCVLLSGKVHLVGIQFDQPIDLNVYLPILKAGSRQSEMSESLVGFVQNQNEASAAPIQVVQAAAPTPQDAATVMPALPAESPAPGNPALAA